MPGAVFRRVARCLSWRALPVGEHRPCRRISHSLSYGIAHAIGVTAGNAEKRVPRYFPTYAARITSPAMIRIAIRIRPAWCLRELWLGENSPFINKRIPVVPTPRR